MIKANAWKSFERDLKNDSWKRRLLCRDWDNFVNAAYINSINILIFQLSPAFKGCVHYIFVRSKREHLWN